jgi:hypothetical protein
VLLLDLPLLLVLVAYGSLVWMHHVHDTYLTAQTDALVWNNERKETEMTYYQRKCDARDITTRHASDLMLDVDATPQQAYAHQLKHGFTVFRNVLSRETAHLLRATIVDRNYNLTADEFIDLHKAENRFGYAVGTEERGVVEALEQVARHEQLTQSMALIMGHDPALIELTQITAKYGAEKQPWHVRVWISCPGVVVCFAAGAIHQFHCIVPKPSHSFFFFFFSPMYMTTPRQLDMAVPMVPVFPFLFSSKTRPSSWVQRGMF